MKGNDHREAVRRVTEHIRQQAYFVVDHDPGSRDRNVASQSGRGSEPRVRLQRRANPHGFSNRKGRYRPESAAGPVIKLPTMGGSVPLDTIENIPRVPAIHTRIANHDNNQYTYNETIRLQNLWDGIELMAGLLAGL